MLPRFKGATVNALGMSLRAYPGDVELNIGRFGITLMWGGMPVTGLFLHAGDRELHLEWPWKPGRGLASG